MIGVKPRSKKTIVLNHVEANGTSKNQNGKSNILSQNTRLRLSVLLKEFPNGLKIDEVVPAYQVILFNI